jgi:hypothetical protein
MQGKTVYIRPKVVGSFPVLCASGSYVHWAALFLHFLAFDLCCIVLCSMQKILKVVLQMLKPSTRKCTRMT